MQQRDIRTRVKNSFVQLEKVSRSGANKEYKVLNISRGGICFESNQEDFELNEMLKLNLVIDNHSIHKANGRVCYCNQCENKNASAFGLSFLDKFIDMDILRNK